MTTLLLGLPRTGRLFRGRIVVTGWSPSTNNQSLVLGCKSTAGAPTTTDDFDVGAGITDLLQSQTLNIRKAGGTVNGVITKNATFTHAPGADVKVYAAFRAGGALDSDPLNNVSAGVLLGA